MRRTLRALTLATSGGLAAATGGPGQTTRPATATPPTPNATYRVYVGAESADLIHHVRGGPCAHGVTVNPDSRYAFVSVEGKGAQPGKVEVFDPVALVKAAIVDVGQQASGVAFWKTEPAAR